MSEAAIALRVLLACAALLALAWVLYAVVRGAKRGGRRMRAIGAAFLMSGWGHMRDPRNDTVAEAKEGRIRRGTYSGDPLDDDHG